MTEGICRLCLKSKELCESHIVPKLYWKRSGIIGAGKKFDAGYIDHPRHTGPVRKNLQDGFKEHLLCLSCEARIEKWERYAEELFYNSRAAIASPTANGFWVPGCNYKKLKLFVMSVLWRMSITTHFYYDEVSKNLSATMKERLRKMLFTAFPGGKFAFGFLLTILRTEGVFADIMLAPKPVRGPDGDEAIVFVIDGLHFMVFLNKPRAVRIQSLLLEERNGCLHFAVHEAKSLPYYDKEIEELYERAKKKLKNPNSF